LSYIADGVEVARREAPTGVRDIQDAVCTLVAVEEYPDAPVLVPIGVGVVGVLYELQDGSVLIVANCLLDKLLQTSMDVPVLSGLDVRANAPLALGPDCMREVPCCCPSGSMKRGCLFHVDGRDRAALMARMDRGAAARLVEISVPVSLSSDPDEGLNPDVIPPRISIPTRT
jgi:hypothetical protein